MHSLIIQIAETNFRISASDKRIVDIARSGFGSFIVKSNRYDVDICIEAREDFIKNPYATGRPHHITVSDLGSCISVNGNTFSGWVDADTKRAEVSMALSVEAFFMVLRFFVFLDLSKNNGIIIHATSVASSGKGYIFAGQPQAGKSTIARLSSDKIVLSDDFSIIRKVKGSYRVFSSPFWGSVIPRAKRSNAGYKIEGVYLLNHSDENFTRPIRSHVRRIKLLHQNTFEIPALRPQSLNIFKCENEISEKVPFYKLYFVPNESVWRHIK